MSTKILVVEDEPEVRDYLGIALRRQGYLTDFAEDGEEAMKCLMRPGSNVGLLLMDIIMPRKDGLDTLREVRLLSPRLPVVMLSGSCSTPHIIEAMKSGADDFLQKPVSYDDLGRSIEKVLRSKSEDSSLELIPAPVRHPEVFVSSWGRKIQGFINQVGESDVPVLLRGETGVGKEVLARQLHARSARREKPFLKVNCAALPSELVESELFGYERGAFTGAFRASEGRFKQADTGTIFLDEIGDMDVKLQAKLLQVLQDHEYLRLGAKEATQVDVRVMAATHCDLEEAISDGRFREDLYYRLNVISVEIPSLRERRDEILGLAHHLLLKHAPEGVRIPEMSLPLQQALLDHDWPGNIRELENVMRQLLVLGDCDAVCMGLRRTRRKLSFAQAAVGVGNGSNGSHYAKSAMTSAEPPITLQGQIENGADGNTDGVVTKFEPQHGEQPSSHMLQKVDEFKRTAEVNVILSALKTTRWNRRQAADLLKVDYKALLYKMKKLKISV